MVGASGVGKDTLLDAARAALEGNAGFVFVRREITRPADAGGEDHDPVDWETFKARRDAGAYALHWEAHGLGYGVPMAIEDGLAQGKRVVVNASRAIVDAARARFKHLRVVNVTAPADVLAARLAGRGRETGSEIAARLARAGEGRVAGADVIEVANGSTIGEGVARFLDALRRN